MTELRSHTKVKAEHRHIAIVPARILRRWDQLAAAQLFELAPRIAEDLEEERRQRCWAEDCAHMWQQISEIQQDGDEVGLTIDGQIVAVPPQASVA